MTALVVFGAFSALLVGVLKFNKLWIGALVGSLILVLRSFLEDGELHLIQPLSNGLIITLELLTLIFGAYFFYNTLKRQNHFDSFVNQLERLPQRLDIVLLFALFFGSFLEGIAGFGIPAMLIAPMLLSMGFKPLTAIVIPLIANTVPVLFGALGTPIVLGLNAGTNSELLLYVLIFNILPILLLPLILALTYEKTEAEQLDWKRTWKKLMMTSFIYAVPFFSTGLFSVELPSVAAGLIGMIVFSLLFLPQQQRPKLELWRSTFWPYLLFIALLLVARFFLRDLTFSTFASAKNVSLYQPGLVFLVAALTYNWIKKQRISTIFSTGKSTLTALQKTAISIVSLVCFTQIVQPHLMQAIIPLLGLVEPNFLAPVLGIIGSFTTGSATMSNLLFSSIIPESAIFLALLHSGSALGNAISLQNIIMVNAVVSGQHSMVKVIKNSGLWVLIYWSCIMVILLILR